MIAASSKYQETIRVHVFAVLQINLRLMMVSGRNAEFLFSASDSAADITQHVFDNWPEGRSKKNFNICFFRASSL